MERKLVSIIVPAFNEEDCIKKLADQLSAVFDINKDYDFEVIFIENGSTDQTWNILETLYNTDSRFKVVQLARNFRMDGGITAGLEFAAGDAVVIMASDLQDPPELITDFIKKWEEGYENIYMVVKKRTGTGYLRRFNSSAFYWLAGKLTHDQIPRNASDFRLVDRKVYEVVRSMDERNRFVRGLFSWVGFRSIGIEYDRSRRYAGKSKAHSLKVIDLAFKGIFAHSYIPLRLITLLGVIFSVLSIFALIILFVDLVLFGVPFAGFGTIVAITLLLSGLLFLMIGIVAEYVGLIYEEVKQRPNFIVRNTLGTFLSSSKKNS